jgi:integrase
MSLSIEEVLDRFRSFLQERKSLSKPLAPKNPPLASDLSVRIYYYMAKRFLNAMIPKYGLPFNEDVAREYLSIYRKRKAKPRTLLVIYSTLKNLYHCMGWPFNIDWREFVPEVERFSDEPYLSKEEIDRVLSYAEEKAKNGNFIDVRNLVILYLLVHGLRPEDIRRLRVKNVSTQKMKVADGEGEYEACVVEYTPCKRGRSTAKIFNLKATLWIERWIGFLEKVFDADELQFAPLIPSMRAENPPNVRSRLKRRKMAMFKPLSYQMMYKIVRRLVLEAFNWDEDVAEKANPYSIRRGIISYLIDSGKASVEDINRWFGWRTPMASVYDKRRSHEVAMKFVNL